MEKIKNRLLKLILGKLKDKDELYLTEELRHIIETKSETRSYNLSDIKKEDLCNEFANERLLDLSLNTKKDYKSVILRLLDSIYQDITGESVFLYLKSKEDSWSLVSKARNYRFIKIFLKYLYEKRYIRKDLSKLIKVPKKVKRDQYVPTDEDIKKFFVAVPEIYKNKNDLLRYQTLFKLYVKTGMRRNELINLNIQYIDFTRGKIILKVTKNKNEDYIKMDEELEMLLNDYIRKFNIKEGPLILGKGERRIQKSVIYKNFNRIKDKAGLPNKFTIHSFRRYFLDKLRREGVDVFRMKELARHKNINTTYGYCNVRDEERKEALSKISVNF